MSRVTRTKIPVTTELLQPKPVTEVYQQLKACQQLQVHYYNQGTKPLTTLELQEVVRLRQGKTWTPAISGRESRNTAALLSHNCDWTTISLKP